MKAGLWIILFLFLLSPAASLAQTEVKKQTHTFSLKGSSSSHEIRFKTEYPLYTQARLRNLKAEIKNSSLVISGNIENMLKRELHNAMIVISLLDKDGAELETLQAKVFPIILERDDRFGRFSAETRYSPEISSCNIEIIWQGKETAP